MDLIRNANWINVTTVIDKLAVEILLDELDIGEAETIVLSKEISADLVLMDEKKGRRKVRQLGLKLSGTIGILLRAKEEKLIKQIKPELDLLLANRFHLSESLRKDALRLAGE